MEYLKTEQKGMQSAKVFFNVFNGLSRDCLTYIECKYDLGYKENNNVKKVLSPDMQHFVFEALPSRIILGFNENKSILANMTDLMEEIEYNIGKCNTHEELEIYVVKLLEPFRVLSEHTATIFQHKDFKKRRKGIVGEMMKLGTVENCLHDLYGVMNRFANRLYAILIQRNFDLSSFQDELEIYIKDGWTAFDIAPFVGGMKRANRFMEQSPIPINSTKHNPKNVIYKPKMKFNCNLSESRARKIFQLLVEGNYISPNTTVNDWLVVCGVADEKEKKAKVDWIKGQNELVYFVDVMFHETNRDVWAISSRVFTINGETQSTDNLRVANSKVNISDEKKKKLDKILRNK